MDYKFSINTNEYLPLRDVVFNTLRDAILKGSLKPGERLMENQLAEKLGVSRTPIREALRMLEIEDLVELVPRKGAQVLDLSPKDIKNVLQIRASLEALAVSIACDKMTPEKLEELKRYNEEFKEYFNSKNYEKAVSIDEKFHDIIFESTENEKLIQVINNLRTQVYRYRIAYLEMRGKTTIILGHHSDIINAIENHDQEEGEKIAKEHVDHQRDLILNSITNRT